MNIENLKKIIDLPENTEITTYDLVKSDNKLDSDFMFEIDKYVIEICKKINITLDKSKYDKQILGLPFNIPFIKKTLSNEIISSIPKSLKEFIYIHNGDIYPKNFLSN